VRREAREHCHGIRRKEMDGASEERVGFGDYSGQDDGGGSGKGL
jgi:hypothetical protein